MERPLVSPCREWAEKLAIAHSADLSPADRQALETHIASCPACHTVLKEYQALDERLHRALHAQQILPIVSESLATEELTEEEPTAIAQEQRHREAGYRSRSFPPLQRVSSLGKFFNTLAAILVLSLLVGSFLILSTTVHRSPATGASTAAGVTATNVTQPPPTTPPSPIPSPTTTPLPIPPTSVELRISAPGISPTSQGNITIPSGTTVTLSVVPDHSLLPFQIYTMGIYATDPYGFSELQDCTYPNTATCTYIVAYSPGEHTDYTHGTHTFRAFLGNVGGAILANSNSITITWS